MAYTAPQIGTILLKADRTMYKIGQIAYENMFAEDNEALDYERDVIFIYKKAVEFADDFFVGTDKLDKVVERLAVKISAYDYGELNPIYADVNTVNIPSVVAGAALNDLTDVTITNLLDNQFLRYNAATGQWINVGPGAAVRNSQAFTATAGQTVFTTSYPFDSGLFDLYVNGVKLNSLSYTTMGEYQITLNDPCIVGDIIDVVIYDPSTSVSPAVGSLNDLTDVSIGPLANNQVLYYNAATGLWQNGLVFVPYTGATASVDLGEFEIRAGQFTLDTSPTGTATVGTTRWNDTIGSSETTLKGGSVILKNGVDLVARVVNKVTPNTTLTKASYAAVRISGAQGQRLAVGYAQANNDANSADTIGLVTETIATNQEGFIMTMGSLEGINTTGSLQGETWADGDVLYLSPTVPGGITNVKPTGLTGHIVVVGYVEYAHANNGKIYIKTMNGWELDELHNVNINTGTLANGDVLKYNSTTQLWENGVSTAGISGSGASGQVTYWTGASAVSGSNNLFWDNTNGRLGIGTNAPEVGKIIDVVFDEPTLGGRGVRIRNTNTTGYSELIFDNNRTPTGTGRFVFGLGGETSGAPDTAYFFLRLNSSLLFGTNNTERARFHGNGNFSINSTSDLGVRLGVVGDTLLRGSGATSATTALTVQNSSSSNLLRILNDGTHKIGGQNIDIYPSSNGSTISNGGRGLIISTNASSQTDAGALKIIGGYSSALGSDYGIWVSHSFTNGTGGVAIHNGILLNQTINQTGGANGITRGLYVNPTLTAAADFRAIETSAGNVLFGSNFFWDNANSRLGIGTNVPTTLLNVRGNYAGALDNLIPQLLFENANNTASAILSAIIRTRISTGYIGGFPELWLDVTRDASNNGFTRVRTVSNHPLSFWTNDTERVRIQANGNISIGTISDLGTRLGVVGDTLLRGSGNTSATTALTVQNSGSTAIFRVRNDGEAFGLNTSSLSFGTFVSQRSNASSSGTARAFWGLNTFGPTTGNAEWNSIHLQLTLTQGGTATGISRGLFVDTTLTSAVDYRAIETTAGNVLFGSNFFWDNANGRLGIGIATPAVSLDVRTSAVGELAYFANTAANSGVIIGTQTNVGYISSISSLSALGFGINGATSGIRIFTNSNVAINSAADLGVRFGVIGDTLLRGSGATSATTALTVQNSDSSNMYRFLNNGRILLGSDANAPYITPAGADGIGSISGLNTLFYTQVVTQNFGIGAFHFWGTTLAPTSGTNTQLSITRQFAPTSGTAAMVYAIINPTINQTGGSNGITRGLYVSPALTAAADWRSIEWSNNSGWGLYGLGTANNYLGGNVAIGSTSNTSDWLNIAASTTAKAHIYLAAGVAPTSPANGDIWFDGTDIKMRIGGVTKTFTLV